MSRGNDITDAMQMVTGAFREADTTGQGTVSPELLLAILAEVGMKLDEGQLDKIVKIAGADQNGSVDYEALMCWLFKEPNWESLSATDTVLSQYVHPWVLREELRAENVVLLRGSWVIGQSSRGALLPRRQDLPAQSVWDADEFFRMVEHMREQDESWMFPMAVVSYCWLTAAHPDPKGEQLSTLAFMTDLFIRFLQQECFADDTSLEAEMAVFIDWCSLYQKPFGTKDEESTFLRGLANINLWYAHQSITKWLITYFPEHWNVRKYHDRGWPTFERAISELITPCGMVLDLGELRPDIQSYQKAILICEAGRRPPITPEVFQKVLSDKVFTQDLDIEIVVRKHYKTFHDIVSATRELDFAHLGWSDDEIFMLCEALPHFLVLESLCLGNNNIGDDGAIRLGQTLASYPTLRRVQLHENQISFEVAEALGTVWAAQAKPLEGLTLYGQSLRVNTPLNTALLKEDNDTVQALAESKAEVVNISNDGYTPLNAAVLEEASAVLQVFAEAKTEVATPSNEGTNDIPRTNDIPFITLDSQAPLQCELSPSTVPSSSPGFQAAPVHDNSSSSGVGKIESCYIQRVIEKHSTYLVLEHIKQDDIPHSLNDSSDESLVHPVSGACGASTHAAPVGKRSRQTFSSKSVSHRKKSPPPKSPPRSSSTEKKKADRRKSSRECEAADAIGAMCESADDRNDALASSTLLGTRSSLFTSGSSKRIASSKSFLGRHTIETEAKSRVSTRSTRKFGSTVMRFAEPEKR